jgi:hypothetical protein
MKTQAIEKVMLSHHLPWALAEQVVDDGGNVDQSKLQAILMGVSWGKTPVASGDPRLVQALSNSYWEAESRKDAVAMISLKNAIGKIGGQLLPRKEK